MSCMRGPKLMNPDWFAGLLISDEIYSKWAKLFPAFLHLRTQTDFSKISFYSIEQEDTARFSSPKKRNHIVLMCLLPLGGGGGLRLHNSLLFLSQKPQSRITA